MSWIQHPVELECRRIKLVPLDAAHIDELCERSQDKRIWEFIPFDTDKGDPRLLRDGFLESLSKQHSGELYNFTVMLKEDDTIIGTTKYWQMNEKFKSLEIGGTWIQPSYWGTGINTECKYLMLHHCFETLKTVRVQIKANYNNLRSRKAIEKLGASFEGIVRNDKIFLDGTTRNSAMYSIINTEWQVIKPRLESKIAAYGIEANMKI